MWARSQIYAAVTVPSCRNCIYFALMSSISASSCPPPKGIFRVRRGQPRLSLNPYFAFRCLFLPAAQCVCLNTFSERCQNAIDRDERGISWRVHILFSLHTSCSFNSGKLPGLKKSCHYFVTQSPRWHLLQITSQPAKKRADNRKSFFPTSDWNAVGGFQTFIYNTMMPIQLQWRKKG